MKHSKVHGLLFVLLHQVVGIKTEFLCPHFEISNYSDYEEFSSPDSQSFRPDEFDPLRLDYETDQPPARTEFLNEDLSTVDISTFRPTEKLSNFGKTRFKTTFNFYQNEFDRRYWQKSNYSEIFQDPIESPSRNSSKPIKLKNYNFSSFPRLYEIYEYLTVLEKLGNGRAIVNPLRHYNGSWNIVHTNLGNEILSIRITSKPLESHEENPIIVVVAGKFGIHGRDWYAIQSAIFLATQLILDGNRSKSQDFDWWIFPILNPDGYEISQIDSEWRNWEKNLHGTRDINTDKCFGIDLDLNFEYQWLSCNDTLCDFNFPGNDPFTTPETQGFRDTLEAYSDFCDSFIALKEGKQSLVFPFSDTLDSPRHVDDLENICEKAIVAFGEHVEGFYDYGQSSYLIGIRAGFIEDWAKVHLGIVKSFAFYLGPREKDRRELKSQHLMDHMNGIYDLLHVIAHERIQEKMQNSSCRDFSSLLFIALNFLIIRYFH